ncbi:PHB depolymerase family esterase [Thalassotalea piscium]
MQHSGVNKLLDLSRSHLKNTSLIYVKSSKFYLINFLIIKTSNNSLNYYYKCKYPMIKKTTISAHFIISSVILFSSLISICFQSHADNWTTEDNLSGMDSVHIYQPTTTPLINNKRALMINLHGCLMSNTNMKEHAGWSQVADKFGMVVALPDVPDRGAFSIDCWDYYGSDHTRLNKYNNDIIQLALELIKRPELNIDPDQVYITGFSSGGGQVNVIACLAPDIFSGVGSASGPGLGTTATQYANVPSHYSNIKQAKSCQDMAGKYSPNFATQIYSTIHGSADTTVAPNFNEHGAAIMANVYGAAHKSSAIPISTDGTNVIFSDSIGPRVSKIVVNGMGHKWPSKNGANTGYFVNNKVNYPNYVTQWFFDNNRRIKKAEDAKTDMN